MAFCFYNKFTVPKIKGHDFTEVKSSTQKYGYIPASQQRKDLENAGKRYDAYHAGLYLYNADGSFELGSVDAILSRNFYADKLTIEEQKAFLAGAKKRFDSHLAKVASDSEAVKSASEKWNKLVSMFNSPAEVTTSVEPVAKAEG